MNKEASFKPGDFVPHFTRQRQRALDQDVLSIERLSEQTLQEMTIKRDQKTRSLLQNFVKQQSFPFSCSQQDDSSKRFLSIRNCKPATIVAEEATTRIETGTVLPDARKPRVSRANNRFPATSTATATDTNTNACSSARPRTRTAATTTAIAIATATATTATTKSIAAGQIAGHKRHGRSPPPPPLVRKTLRNVKEFNQVLEDLRTELRNSSCSSKTEEERFFAMRRVMLATEMPCDLEATDVAAKYAFDPLVMEAACASVLELRIPSTCSARDASAAQLAATIIQGASRKCAPFVPSMFNLFELYNTEHKTWIAFRSIGSTMYAIHILARKAYDDPWIHVATLLHTLNPLPLPVEDPTPLALRPPWAQPWAVSWRTAASCQTASASASANAETERKTDSATLVPRTKMGGRSTLLKDLRGLPTSSAHTWETVEPLIAGARDALYCMQERCHCMASAWDILRHGVYSMPPCGCDRGLRAICLMTCAKRAVEDRKAAVRASVARAEQEAEEHARKQAELRALYVDAGGDEADFTASFPAHSHSVPATVLGGSTPAVAPTTAPNLAVLNPSWRARCIISGSHTHGAISDDWALFVDAFLGKLGVEAQSTLHSCIETPQELEAQWPECIEAPVDAFRDLGITTLDLSDEAVLSSLLADTSLRDAGIDIPLPPHLQHLRTPALGSICCATEVETATSTLDSNSTSSAPAPAPTKRARMIHPHDNLNGDLIKETESATTDDFRKIMQALPLPVFDVVPAMLFPSQIPSQIPPQILPHIPSRVSHVPTCAVSTNVKPKERQRPRSSSY